MGKHVVAAAICLLIFAASVIAADFEAIPDVLESGYKFDLEGMFYADDAGYEADLEWLTGEIEDILDL